MTAELREGFRVVRVRPRLRLLLGMSGCVYLTLGAFLVIEPIYVREVLQGSPTMLALLQATFGVGLLVMTLVVTRLGERVAACGSPRSRPCGLGSGCRAVRRYDDPRGGVPGHPALGMRHLVLCRARAGR